MLNGLGEKQVPARLTKHLQINSESSSDVMTDICGSVQIWFSPTAPQLENSHVSFVGKPPFQMC